MEIWGNYGKRAKNNEFAIKNMRKKEFTSIGIRTVDEREAHTLQKVTRDIMWLVDADEEHAPRNLKIFYFILRRLEIKHMTSKGRAWIKTTSF